MPSAKNRNRPSTTIRLLLTPMRSKLRLKILRIDHTATDSAN
ncbi:hypothetical protein AAKU61_003726 [Undibacterium sp. GrIS 1.2]